jgi:hypothetical protein
MIHLIIFLEKVARAGVDVMIIISGEFFQISSKKLAFFTKTKPFSE